MILESFYWPEPVEVKKVDEFGDRVHIIGATIHSNIHIDQLLPKEEVEKLKTKEPLQKEQDFHGSMLIKIMAKEKIFRRSILRPHR